MPARVGVNFIGENRSALGAIRQTQAGLRGVTTTAEQMGAVTATASEEGAAGLTSLAGRAEAATGTLRAATGASEGLAVAQTEVAATSGRASLGMVGMGRNANRAERGALAASGAFHGFGRALTFASNAFIGGAVIGFELRAIIQATKELQVAQGQLQVAVKNTGLAWETDGRALDRAAAAQSRLTGFTRVETTTALARLVTATGDVEKSTNLLSISQDVARGRNMDLVSAAGMLAKANVGQFRALKMLGLPLQTVTRNYDHLVATTKNATKAQKDHAKELDKQETILRALDLLQSRYSGSAERYAHTAAGASARFHAALEELQVALGKGILPALTPLIERAAKWAEGMAKGGKATSAARRAVHGFSEVIHELGPAFHDAIEAFKLARRALGGIADAVGGWDKLFRLVLYGYLAKKFIGLAFAIGESRLALLLLGRTAPLTAASVVASEQAMGAGALLTAARFGGLAAAAVGLNVLIQKNTSHILQFGNGWKTAGVHALLALNPITGPLEAINLALGELQKRTGFFSHGAQFKGMKGPFDAFKIGLTGMGGKTVMALRDVNTKISDFRANMAKLASSVASSNPTLAAQARVLAAIAKTTGEIPSRKTVNTILKIQGKKELDDLLVKQYLLRSKTVTYTVQTKHTTGAGPGGTRRGGRVGGDPSRDATPLLAAGGEFVVTGGGERLLEGLTFPGVLDWIGRIQPPHFGGGGRVHPLARHAAPIRAVPRSSYRQGGRVGGGGGVLAPVYIDRVEVNVAGHVTTERQLGERIAPHVRDALERQLRSGANILGARGR